MRKEQDLSKVETVRNPYFERLSKEVAFRLDFNSIAYFQKVGEAYGFSAEQVMQLYLQKLAGSGRKLNIGFPTLEERRDLDAYIDRQLKLAGEA